MGQQTSVANPSNVQPSGKGGMTSSLTSDQPSMGQPNNNVWQGQQKQYPNTVGQWDNASIMPNQQNSGKSGGKSGSSQGTSGKGGQQPSFDVYTPPPGGYQFNQEQQPNDLINQQSDPRNNGSINGM